MSFDSLQILYECFSLNPKGFITTGSLDPETSTLFGFTLYFSHSDLVIFFSFVVEKWRQIQ